MFLPQKIESLPATSVLTIKRLKSLGIQTYWDLLNYFPSRHEDYSAISPIGKVQEGEKVTIKGRILTVKNNYVRKRLTIQHITVSDGTGTITVTWFNQPFLLRLFNPEAHISISGIIKKHVKLIIEPKEYEILKNADQDTVHTGKIIPIYPAKRGLSSRTIRDKIFSVSSVLKEKRGNDFEILPETIVKKHRLIDESLAYKNIHFPKSNVELEQAKKRLAFDELFIIQLSAKLVRLHWEKEKVGNLLSVKKYQKKIDEFVSSLSFTLTAGQKKVIKEILTDLGKKHPMNRFLQGDVGSGKTVVAAIGSLVSYLNGFQTLFMAPTEILAGQHYKTLLSLFKNTPVKIGLQTASKKFRKDADIVIGTHALLTKSVNFKKVGFVVIDEQHRFGVRQRAILKEKGSNPHLLSMTATPIPRTVALTLYGELDLSHLDEMPQGRVPIKTYLVPNQKRFDGYKWILEKVKKERAQVFVICPLIEESIVETLQSVRAATKEYEHLKKNVFPALRLGLIHGRMKSKEKDEAMNKFKEHQYDILVATSVVEVGIDIPGATIMLIEGAERYGLAQLHQLRGRVGRSDKQSYCLVFTDSNDPARLDRLSFFAKNINGQKLAEYDFKRRGPGNLYGVEQHGYDSLSVASFADYALINETKEAVTGFMKTYSLEKLPALKDRVDLFQVHLIAQD